MHVYFYTCKRTCVCVYASHKCVLLWMAQGMAWVEGEHLELSAVTRISTFIPKVYEIINVHTLKSLEYQTPKTKVIYWEAGDRFLWFRFLSSPQNYTSYKISIDTFFWIMAALLVFASVLANIKWRW